MRHYIFNSNINFYPPPLNLPEVWYPVFYCDNSIYMTFGHSKVCEYHWHDRMFWTAERPSLCLGDYNQAFFDWKTRKYQEIVHNLCTKCENQLFKQANAR